MSLTEKEKFEHWFEAEVAKGMMDYHISWNHESIAAAGLSVEDAYRELNQMNAAIAAGDFTTVEFEDF